MNLRLAPSRALAILAILTATAGIAIPATGVAAVTARVKVVDDRFKPTSVTVKKGDKVKFKWSDSNENPHNATLQKGPSGVDKRDFRSRTDKTGVRFVPRFKRAGKYQFNCTIHPGMEMTVVVKR